MSVVPWYFWGRTRFKSKFVFLAVELLRAFIDLWQGHTISFTTFSALASEPDGFSASRCASGSICPWVVVFSPLPFL